MSTFRAAYVPADSKSNGVGLLLTTETMATWSDTELLAAAHAVAHEVGCEGEIVIGEWTE